MNMFKIDDTVEYLNKSDVFVSGVITAISDDLIPIITFRAFSQSDSIAVDAHRLKSTPTYGGVRAGAGRKPNHPGEETQRIELTLPKSLVSKIDTRGHSHGVTRNSLITKLLTSATEQWIS